MDLSRFRNEFPATRRLAYLSNAAVSPISSRVVKYMDDWARDAREVGVLGFRNWKAVQEKARELSARILGCEPGEVAFASSTSGALSLFASSLDWRPIDNVVTAANEFPSNMYPWMNLKHRGVQVRQVRPTAEGRVLIEDLLSAADSRTRVIAISWVGFNTGFRIDLARLGAECAKRGIHLVVDAIQGLGAFEMKAREWNVTAAAADAHKWLLGPEGAALLYVSKDIVGSLHVPIAGWKSIVDSENFMRYDFVPRPDSKRFEPGSLNVPGIHGLFGALELFYEAGMDNVTARVKEVTDYLVSGLGRKGLEVRSPRGRDEWSGIVSFAAPGGDGPAVEKALREKDIVCTGRADFIRVSPHFYNNEEDIDRLLAEV